MKDYWNSLSVIGKTKLVVAILVGLLTLTFAIQNWKSVEVKHVIGSSTIPLTILILVSIAAGFLMATIFDYRKFKKKDAEIKDLKAKLEAMKSRQQ